MYNEVVKDGTHYEEMAEEYAETMKLEDVGDVNKETTSSERSGAISGNSSSEGLPTERSEHLSHDAHAETLDAAKLQKNTEITLRAAKKIQNEGGLKDKMTTPEEAVRAVGKGLHLRKSDSSQSYYGDFYEGEFEIDGKTIKVRVSTHPATGKRLGNANADKKVGIVIYKNGEHQDKGPHNGYIEYSYYPKDISPAESANAVIKGIEQLIKTGKYVDITGKAIPKEYPYIKDGEKVYSLKEETTKRDERRDSEESKKLLKN